MQGWPENINTLVSPVVSSLQAHSVQKHSHRRTNKDIPLLQNILIGFLSMCIFFHLKRYFFCFDNFACYRGGKKTLLIKFKFLCSVYPGQTGIGFVVDSDRYGVSG